MGKRVVFIDLLDALAAMDVLYHYRFNYSTRKLTKTILDEVSQYGLEGHNEREISISFEKVSNYLIEAREQASVGEFHGAAILMQGIRNEMIRCGIKSQSPKEEAQA